MLLAKMGLSQPLEWVPWPRDLQQEPSAQWRGREEVLAAPRPPRACSNLLDSGLGFEATPSRLAEQRRLEAAVELSLHLFISAMGGEAAGF